MRSLFLFCVMVFVSAVAGDAYAKRIALVIGNDNYDHVPDLKKAVNDANTIGNTLKGLGFEVLTGQNLGRRDLNKKLLEFTSRVEKGDTALFFFSGHGIEIRGRNYLLPIDVPSAKPGQESFVVSESLSVEGVLEQIVDRQSAVNIFILDACRNNPFPKSGTKSLGGKRGIARMAAPKGTFIMYSAGVQQEALDRLNENDSHPNSVFTRKLVPLITKPGMPLTDVARQVRRDVEKLASTVPHEQRPAYYDEITGSFYFKPMPVQQVAAPAGRIPPAAIPAPAQQPQSPEMALLGTSQDEALWATIRSSQKITDYEFYLLEHPKGRYSSVAKLKLKRLREEIPADKEQKLAHLQDPAGGSATHVLPEDVNTPKPMGQAELAAGMSAELERIGCRPGKVDNEWGVKDRLALSRFNKYAKLKLSVVVPSEASLDVLKGYKRRICPGLNQREPVKVYKKKKSKPKTKKAYTRTKPKKTYKKKPKKGMSCSACLGQYSNQVHGAAMCQSYCN